MKKETDKTQKTDRPANSPVKSAKRQLRGIVVSDKMKDTVVVKVERFFRHKKYKKYISRSKKFMAHDAGNVHKIGDRVTIEETAPISRHKRFRVVSVQAASKT